jgi:hypothetical protein
VASSNGSIVAEASSTRRLGKMSGTRASYHVPPAGPIREMVQPRIG